MSLLDSMFRQRPLQPDDAIEESLRAMLADIEPDPLFVRRLRGEATNRYVAAREGHVAPGADRRANAMGRLGRACLIASFALGASAMSVMAASQVALPGDPLYGLKLRIEQVRLDVLPAHLDDELEAYTLAVRVDELGRLADAGRWDDAIAMTPLVEQAYEGLVQNQDARGNSSAVSQRHLLVLEGLVDGLPDGARAAVQGVIDRAGGDVPGSRGGASEGGPRVSGNGIDADAPRDPSNGRVPGPADPTPAPSETPGPEPTPEAETTPKPEPTPKPETTPKPDSTPRPEPRPRPERTPNPGGGHKAPQQPADAGGGSAEGDGGY